MVTKKDKKAKLVAERGKINDKANQTAADKKRLGVIAEELKGLRAEAFSRLASMRTTKAINSMRGLQKLSNRNNYEYTPEQVTKILAALKKEIEAIHAAFTTTGGEAKELFSV